MNNNVLKGMVLAVMIMYIASPVDACPGPVDDLIVLLLAVAARKKLNHAEDRG